jgi:hypothetical protein
LVKTKASVAADSPTAYASFAFINAIFGSVYIRYCSPLGRNMVT